MHAKYKKSKEKYVGFDIGGWGERVTYKEQTGRYQRVGILEAVTMGWDNSNPHVET